MTPPLYVLLSALRRDSAEVLRESRKRRHFVGPAERRRTKSARAQERARPNARSRPPVLVIRPVTKQKEVTTA